MAFSKYNIVYHKIKAATVKMYLICNIVKLFSKSFFCLQLPKDYTTSTGLLNATTAWDAQYQVASQLGLSVGTWC